MSTATHTIGVPGQRAAGARSGIGTSCLDAALPFRGLVGDTLAREAKGQSPAYRAVDHGDGGKTELLAAITHPGRMTGSIPERSTHRRLASIPGYSGHIEGKVAENVHGGTFRSENERTIRSLDKRTLRQSFSAPHVMTISAPPHQMTQDAICDQQRQHGRTMGFDGKALNVAPQIPGYMTTMPGKLSESVHGVTTAEASRRAQELRGFNPHVSCESWSRKGVWPSCRRPTYKFNNRFVVSDAQHLFSRAQDEEYAEQNALLGHTFGLDPTRPSAWKPGDRYMQTSNPKGKEEKRKQPHLMPPAGAATHSMLLEPERFKLHMSLSPKV